MTGRSLRASAEGIQIIRKAIKHDGWKQDELKDELGLKTRQPITRLLRGDPIERATFEELCLLLGLEVDQVAVLETEQPVQDIDELVKTIREQIRPDIQERCGTMRVLDMTQPIELTGNRGIYTHVNILEKLTRLRRLEIAELLEHCKPEDFERFGLSRITEERILGLEAVQRHHKLMMLGKPGAGKTTFLKYLAMHCIAGDFLTDRVPLFVTLKDFAETVGQPDLLEYLSRTLPDEPVGARHWAQTSSQNSKNPHPNATPLLELLRAGRLLILLDGLDEVREEDTPRVIRQIREFSDSFARNQFVITCRIAANEYTFERFTEVEVDDFDKDQIADFARNWFRARGDFARAAQFLQELESNEPIKELVTSPLLLILLCLVFEKRKALPKRRSKLYDEGLDLLLEQWDKKRGVTRQDRVYKNLSLRQKKDLLSRIALTTFENQSYFFEPERVEDLITDFFSNLSSNDWSLDVDGKFILQSIETQHGLLVERAKGIYSFSHLTFHEYFAAREIVSNPGATSLPQLVTHLTEKRWREVFFLTAGMMRNADELMLAMKQKTDELLAANEKLQQFLAWVQHKSSAVDVPYKASAVRAYYSALARAHNLALALDLDRTLALDCDLDLDRALALTLDRARTIARALVRVLALDCALDRTLARTLALALDSELKQTLQQLRDQLPDPSEEVFWQWWQVNGLAWTEQLRAVMIEHRNIGHDWQFSDAQRQLLRQYYDANLLLVECLNSDCYVSREVRAEIEATLLLPTAAIGDGRSAL